MPRQKPADDRAAGIMEVQRDIARRRRRQLRHLATRLAAFVLVPTLLVAFYQAHVATPLYATDSEFVIQTAGQGSGGAGGLAGLLGPGSTAGRQENAAIQAYLLSREAMLRLDGELGFRAHFSSTEIDPLTRIAPDATMEDVYATYRRHLSVSYDPTEGLIRTEVIAATPDMSLALAQALIRYAEERVERMSGRQREDILADAGDRVAAAEARLAEAQARMLDLQERRGALSTGTDDTTLITRISGLERDLRDERLRLDALLSMPDPDAARLDLTVRAIARQEALIDELRARLSLRADNAGALARLEAELILAGAELETRQLVLSQALTQMESARSEANRRSLSLLVGAAPVAPDAARYPRALENTGLALLIFTGAYLLVSMTLSILREQVIS